MNFLKDYRLKHQVEPLSEEELREFAEICELEHVSITEKVRQLTSKQNRETDEVTRIIRNHVFLYRLRKVSSSRGKLEKVT